VHFSSHYTLIIHQYINVHYALVCYYNTVTIPGFTSYVPFSHLSNLRIMTNICNHTEVISSKQYMIKQSVRKCSNNIERESNVYIEMSHSHYFSVTNNNFFMFNIFNLSINGKPQIFLPISIALSFPECDIIEIIDNYINFQIHILNFAIYI
jgi:hypothetical protein